MKRKNDLEMLKYWEVENSPQSDEPVFEDDSFEEMWEDPSTPGLFSALKSVGDVTYLRITPDHNIFLLDKSRRPIYQVTVPDIKHSPLLHRFLDGGVGDELMLTEQNIKGHGYNKQLFLDMVGSHENTYFLDQDCPLCGHLLEKDHGFAEGPIVVTCSNPECRYIDDSETDYSSNMVRYNDWVAQIRREGVMEITGAQRDHFIEKQEAAQKENPDLSTSSAECEDCNGGTRVIENVFVEKKNNEILYRWLSKCNRCHRTRYAYQLSKKDPLIASLFGPAE